MLRLAIARVVLLPENGLGGPVLLPRKFLPFLTRHHAIGLRNLLIVLDFGLLEFEPGGFFLRQLTAPNALFDPLLLLNLAFSDSRRRGGLCLRRHSGGQEEEKNEENRECFHIIQSLIIEKS
jgi:hypothetical protein